MLGRETGGVVIPDRIRGRGMELGQVTRPLAGGDDIKAAGTSPVHLLANQCRLVAIGQGIDDAGLLRPLRQQRSGQGIGLDVDHYQMAPVFAARRMMANTRRRVAAGIDDDIDAVGGDQEVGVVGNHGRAAFERRGE